MDARTAADIGDDVFLAAVAQAASMRGFTMATRWDVAALLAGFPSHVGETTFDDAGMPEKVVLAKARQLIRRGALAGCACGCRGDFEVMP
ncbi:MAG TPA: hypothetical protein VIV12_10955 [Streptosporangiaceae bacterium]